MTRRPRGPVWPTHRAKAKSGLKRRTLRPVLLTPATFETGRREAS